MTKEMENAMEDLARALDRLYLTLLCKGEDGRLYYSPRKNGGVSASVPHGIGYRRRNCVP